MMLPCVLESCRGGVKITRSASPVRRHPPEEVGVQRRLMACIPAQCSMACATNRVCPVMHRSIIPFVPSGTGVLSTLVAATTGTDWMVVSHLLPLGADGACTTILTGGCCRRRECGNFALMKRTSCSVTSNGMAAALSGAVAQQQGTRTIPTMVTLMHCKNVFINEGKRTFIERRKKNEVNRN